MSGLNLPEFERRLARIDRIHKAGGAFEANGTLGRSYYASLARPRRARGGLLRPLAVLLAAVLLFKGAVYGQIGPAGYDQRVADLAAGGALDRAGAWVMTADPLTRQIGAAIRPLVY